MCYTASTAIRSTAEDSSRFVQFKFDDFTLVVTQLKKNLLLVVSLAALDLQTLAWCNIYV